MKYLFAFLLLTSPALADDYQIWTPTLPSGSMQSFSIQGPTYLTITCGKGNVSVSMEDGSVKFDGGCEPDDAAKSFWTAIRQMYGVGCQKINEK